jgi:NAD(P)-dependent dehydrogenase (short-subunit alcohol dehydrogenase family)
MVPMLRFGRAGEIAAAIAFLLSDVHRSSRVRPCSSTAARQSDDR